MESEKSVSEKISKWRALTFDLSITFLKLRYKGTILGFFWSFLEPLLFLSLFYFVFKNIFGNSIPNFELHLFLGLILFFMFSRGTSMGLTSISSNAHIVSNVKIPKIILPLSYNLTAFIMMGFDLSIFFVFMAVTQFVPTYTIILFPIFAILTLILSTGVSLILSIISVKIKDLNYVWIVITNAIVFLTPIFWKLENLSQSIKEILQFSPWVQLVTMAQDVVLYNKLPEPLTLLYITSFISITLIIGIIIFKKMQNKILENL